MPRKLACRNSSTNLRISKNRQKNTSSWGDPVRFAIQAAQRLINTLETAETDGLSSVKAVSSVLIRQNFSKSRSHNTKNSRESPYNGFPPIKKHMKSRLRSACRLGKRFICFLIGILRYIGLKSIRKIKKVPNKAKTKKKKAK